MLSLRTCVGALRSDGELEGLGGNGGVVIPCMWW